MEWIKKLKSGVRSYIQYTDWLLLLATTAASVYGLVLLYSVSQTDGSGKSGYLMQLICFFIGTAAAIVISKIDYEIIGRLWPVLSGIAIVLMLLTFTPLGLNVAGTDDTAWLGFPHNNPKVTFQPAELLKITFIISFATHLSKVRDHINELKTVLLLGVHGAIPTLLVFFQGDDGTALVFICIFISMMLLAGLRPLYFLIAATAGLGAIPVVWQFMLSEDKKERFLCLVFVDEFLQGKGFQQHWGLVAMGSGKLTGLGYMQGTGSHVFARNTDMIFTVAGEEFGFIGAIALLGVLLLVLLALLRELMTARDLQGMLMCAGVMAMIGFQSLINIGMNLRLVPVIGITLPFFSRGGSSLATLYLGVGLALSVYYSSRARVRNTIFAKRKY